MRNFGKTESEPSMGRLIVQVNGSETWTIKLIGSLLLKGSFERDVPKRPCYDGLFRRRNMLGGKEGMG